MPGRAETTDAKGWQVVEHVSMVCKDCGGDVDYFIGDDCPSCGHIYISCKNCGWKFDFGE